MQLAGLSIRLVKRDKGTIHFESEGILGKQCWAGQVGGVWSTMVMVRC